MNGLAAPVRISRTVDEFDVANPDDSDRYLFSRCGPPAALGVWVVSRSWLVAICSGATLLIGFLAIFAKLRFRTTWLGIAGLALLAAVLVQPSVMFLVLESALLGVVLTLVGLVIELLIERTRSRSVRRAPVVIAASRPVPDSSLNRSPERRLRRFDGDPRAAIVHAGFRSGSDRRARGIG